MANQYFEDILNQCIEKFIFDFKRWSRQIYTNKATNKLIHAGEFGTYRETLCKEFLTHFIPQTLAIGSGYVIGHNDFISNQSDIIVYDKELTPMIEDINKQRFFPIENVVAVCEIKSKLTKTQFIDSLTYLKKIKKERSNLDTPCFHQSYMGNQQRPAYSPEGVLTDQIGTFIICEKLDFNFREFNFEEFYKDEHPSTKINMILSLDDGVFLYKSVDNYLTPYPFDSSPRKGIFNLCKYKEADKFIPIKIFASNFFTFTKTSIRLHSDIASYISINSDTFEKELIK